MVNGEILGALRSSLLRGESLKKAMMTLYNAGYKREEISEAAKAINENHLPSPLASSATQSAKQGNSKEQSLTKERSTSPKELSPPSKPLKKSQKSQVSTYPSKPLKKALKPQSSSQVPSPVRPQMIPNSVKPPVKPQGAIQEVSTYEQSIKPKGKGVMIIVNKDLY